MDFIVNLMGKVIVLFDIEQGKIMSLIEKDYGLIRYILKILRRFVVSQTKGGYLIFENKPEEVYLHRIILQYYAQYDDKLRSILNNTSEYEVNHKNKNKWDNRLENLEMVTKLGNQLHKKNQKYDDEIMMSTEEILEIKAKNVKEKDRKFLEKVSNFSLKVLNEVNLNWSNDKKVFDNLYIRFNNKNIPTTKTTKYTININDLIGLNNSIKLIIKNTNLIKHNNLFELILDYKNYRCNNILQNNLKLINKYYIKNQCFKTLLKKHKLIKPNKEFDLYSNIFLLLLYYLHKTPAEVTFYKNQLFTSISIRHLIMVQGKYKSLKVLYLLGLLKRQKVPFNTRTHTISAFLIPEYTEELFSSTILPRAKQLIDMDLSKITYTIVARNFDLETADFVFKNDKLKSKATVDFITIDDILTILATSSTLKDKITRYGFITANDIRYELQLLNEERKEKRFTFPRNSRFGYYFCYFYGTKYYRNKRFIERIRFKIYET